MRKGQEQSCFFFFLSINSLTQLYSNGFILIKIEAMIKEKLNDIREYVYTAIINGNYKHVEITRFYWIIEIDDYKLDIWIANQEAFISISQLAHIEFTDKEKKDIWNVYISIYTELHNEVIIKEIEELKKQLK